MVVFLGGRGADEKKKVLPFIFSIASPPTHNRFNPQPRYSLNIQGAYCAPHANMFCGADLLPWRMFPISFWSSVFLFFFCTSQANAGFSKEPFRMHECCPTCAESYIPYLG